MENQRARIYATCAVQLDTDHTVAAEGTFDAALTNALVAIVAHEWPGEEKRQGKTHLKAAGSLLKVIKSKVKEAPDKSGVCLIPDPEPASDHEPPADTSDSIFSWVQRPSSATWSGTRIDVETLQDALAITQPIRHGRSDGERHLEKRHIEALLDLDDHQSLSALSAEQQNRHERTSDEKDQREQARAHNRLELLGHDEASRRAAVAAQVHTGYHPKHNPDGLNLQDCPVCNYEAFSSIGSDSLDMQIGIGQCLVCHYERSRETAEAEALQEFYAIRLADD